MERDKVLDIREFVYDFLKRFSSFVSLALES